MTVPGYFGHQCPSIEEENKLPDQIKSGGVYVVYPVVSFFNTAIMFGDQIVGGIARNQDTTDVSARSRISLYLEV